VADVTTYLDNDTPTIDSGVELLSKSVVLPSSGINDGDNVQLFTFPPGFRGRIFKADLVVSATLGADATVRARINRAGSRTAITAASTAAAASKSSDAAQTAVPFDVQGGDILELLVGGANVTASATAAVHLGVTPISG
jgi:hypothetical protein